MKPGSGDGDLPGGGGGKAPPDGPPPPPSDGSSAGDQAARDLVTLGQGKPLTLGNAEDKLADDPQMRSFSSHDFTYDKTGLPHYPDDVKAVVSSVTYGPGEGTDTYRTGAAIVTASSFETVVAWYQKNLPGGWQSTTMGDFGQLGASAQQLSPENLLKMLGSAGQNGAANPLTQAPASAPADRIRISIFKPPSGAANSPGIMIVQKGDSPVEALLQAHVGR